MYCTYKLTCVLNFKCIAYSFYNILQHATLHYMYCMCKTQAGQLRPVGASSSARGFSRTYCSPGRCRTSWRSVGDSAATTRTPATGWRRASGRRSASRALCATRSDSRRSRRSRPPPASRASRSSRSPPSPTRTSCTSRTRSLASPHPPPARRRARRPPVARSSATLSSTCPSFSRYCCSPKSRRTNRTARKFFQLIGAQVHISLHSFRLSLLFQGRGS